MNAAAESFDRLAIEVEYKIAELDDRLGVALGPAHDRVDACDQFVLVERLGHVVVGPKTETFTLILDTGETGKNQDRCLDPGYPQRSEHLEARYVWKVQIQQDKVVIVQLAEVDTLLTQIRRVDIEALGSEHQLDRLSCGAIILDQQCPHD